MAKDESYLRFYNSYFRWLLDQVMYDDMRRSGRSYRKLLEYMRNVQFTWLIDFDKNRADDGKNLRYIFQTETGIEGEIKGACSFLEMCIALARRINDDIFEPDPMARPARWFWIMMENCGLDEFTDDRFNEEKVGEIVDRIINREYKKSGKGGLFPLKNAVKDQRKVQIWYQMQSYILENFDY